MLRQGPIPRAVHGMLDYGIAVLLIAAPFIFGFDDEGAATAVSVIAGVVTLVSAASTKCFPTSVIKSVPLAGHVTLDFALAALFFASPFLFGFDDRDEALVFFIAFAVVATLYTLATRWMPPKDAPAENAPTAA
jgi:hypothetical protein